MSKRAEYIWAIVALLITAGVVVVFYARQPPHPRGPQPKRTTGASATKNEPSGDSTAAALRKAKHSLESLDQAANESDWEGVGNHFSSFQEATRILPLPELRHPDISMALLDFFSLYEVQLERAIEREEQPTVIYASNQLEGIVDDLIAQLNPGVPPELGRLRFLSRDISYWAGAGDERMLRVRAAGLEKLWSDLRPLIVDRNGRKAAENFDVLLLQLQSAGGPEDIQTISPQLQNAVRDLEAILAKR